MNNSKYIDTWSELSQLASISLIVLFLGVFSGIVYLQFNPNALNQASSIFDDDEFYGESIEFTEDQVALLSKNYRESDQEFVYCMEVDGGSVESMSFSPNVTEAKRDSVSYKCGSDKNGVVHSHPGPFGIPQLSEQDKKTLSENPYLDVSCVVAGTIPDYEWQNPTGLNCFDKSFDRLDIQIR